jgi:hypothetical protein
MASLLGRWTAFTFTASGISKGSRLSQHAVPGHAHVGADGVRIPLDAQEGDRQLVAPRRDGGRDDPEWRRGCPRVAFSGSAEGHPMGLATSSTVGSCTATGTRPRPYLLAQ